MRLGLTFLFAAFAALANPAAARAADPADRVVVELFTSQGCSDCPTADSIVTDLASRRDVIALTFPITYWDMLGWKDTLATEANSQRQKAYAKIMSRSGLSTPQMIVGGVDHVLGNQRDKVVATIAKRAEEQLRSRSARVTLSPGAEHILIAVSAARNVGDAEPATVWVMRTLSHARVAVAGGENKNRELIYTNVVRELQRLGTWEREPKTFTISVRAEHTRHDGVAVIVQSREHGPVLGAAFAQLRNAQPR